LSAHRRHHRDRRTERWRIGWSYGGGLPPAPL
jgi:hypothetical protein